MDPRERIVAIFCVISCATIAAIFWLVLRRAHLASFIFNRRMWHSKFKRSDVEACFKNQIVTTQRLVSQTKTFDNAPFFGMPTKKGFVIHHAHSKTRLYVSILGTGSGTLISILYFRPTGIMLLLAGLAVILSLISFVPSLTLTVPFFLLLLVLDRRFQLEFENRQIELLRARLKTFDPNLDDK